MTPPVHRSERIAQIAIVVFAVLIQVIRITHGIDFNDEMQYYGELQGLMTHGRLYSNDLFIQQNSSLLLYPFLKPYSAVYGMSSIIVIGRIVFAAFVLWVFAHTRRTLIAARIAAIPASLAALAVTFVVPFMNLYAVSYNTVSLGLLAACFAEFTAWNTSERRVSVVFWTAAVVMMAIVYPPLAIAVGAALSLRLLVERNFSALRHIWAAWTLTSLAVAAALVLLGVVRYDDVKDVVALSGATSVGAVFSTGLVRLCCLVVVAAALVALTEGTAPAWIVRSRRTVQLLVAVGLAAAGLLAGIFNVLGHAWVASLACLFSGVVMTAWRPAHSIQRRWISALFLVSAIAIAMASSNGFAQISGTAMLAAITFIAMSTVSRSEVLNWRPNGVAVSSGLLAILLCYFCFSPYADATLWHLTRRTDEAPALRHLRIDPAKAQAIHDIRAQLSDIPENSTLMVFGAAPWIYFATNTQPDTDLIFMHSMGTSASHALLAERLRRRRPDFLVSAGRVPESVTAAFKDIVRLGPYACEQRPASPVMSDSRNLLRLIFFDAPQTLTVCRWQRAQS